ncbi:Hypothetical predicted protein [Pelobates cultripes]|uniref:Uncharacterized protein n=1 Tax=Pelobates cultripes TaxID=61616 RepID=A0AAD1R0F9_PELCU|nr:Hypothetical predicted protein [Pelobates cultripes]
MIFKQSLLVFVFFGMISLSICRPGKYEERYVREEANEEPGDADEEKEEERGTDEENEEEPDEDEEEEAEEEENENDRGEEEENTKKKRLLGELVSNLGL